MRENLIDRMIRIYGFEHPIVIQFAELCERMADTEYNNKALITLVEVHEKILCFKKKGLDKSPLVCYNKYRN